MVLCLNAVSLFEFDRKRIHSDFFMKPVGSREWNVEHYYYHRFVSYWGETYFILWLYESELGQTDQQLLLDSSPFFCPFLLTFGWWIGQASPTTSSAASIFVSRFSFLDAHPYVSDPSSLINGERERERWCSRRVDTTSCSCRDNAKRQQLTIRDRESENGDCDDSDGKQ